MSQAQDVPRDDHPLDFRCALVDLGDAHIPEVALHLGLFQDCQERGDALRVGGPEHSVLLHGPTRPAPASLTNPSTGRDPTRTTLFGWPEGTDLLPIYGGWLHTFVGTALARMGLDPLVAYTTVVCLWLAVAGLAGVALARAAITASRVSFSWLA